jgi:peptidoglycan/LPS O-acetylase OafA/YrhL
MIPSQSTSRLAEGHIADEATAPLQTLEHGGPAAARHRRQRGGATDGGPKSDRFRGDVAGLRAIAVVLVLLYHANVPFLPAGFLGVDVFFVISGYLITGQLLAEIDRTGRISLTAFYARRAKRILPAAAVVLIATAGAVWLFLPRVRWQDIGGDIVSAATYVINWRLADRAVDYLAQDTPPSPVQHFWSLAVEEQFYVVWPLLILLAILVAKAWRRRVRTTLWIGLVVVAVPSFIWSILYTASNPGRAFFVSTTRVWELAVGAGIALAATLVARIPKAMALIIGWAGLAAIVVSAIAFSAVTSWPGYAAALPVLGAASVIAAGANAGSRGPIAILGTRPFRAVGDLSYSLYLWHWPMIAIATDHWNGLSVERGLIIVVASAVPAWLTYHLIENPLRYSRSLSTSPRFALSLGGNFSLAGVCAGLALVLIVALSTGGTGDSGRPAPGAAALAAPSAGASVAPIPDRADFITPDPLKATKDIPVTTPDGCFQNEVSAEVLWCTYGNKNSSTEVVLVGDSKMDEWFPAFEMLADQNNWKLSIAVKGACAFTSAPAITGLDATKPYTSCTQWNKNLLAKLVADRPAYVVTSQGSGWAADSSNHTSVDAMAAGMRTSWATLDRIGTKVIVVANNPHPGLNVDQCVDKNRTHLSACTYSSNVHLTDGAYVTQLLAVSGAPKVKMVDMFSAICATPICATVIGDVLVYRQGSHLTATYVKSLTPKLATALTSAGLPAQFKAGSR